MIISIETLIIPSVVRQKSLYIGFHTILQFEFIRRKLEGSSS